MGGSASTASRCGTEWVVPDPEAIQGKADPAAVKMAASWLRQVELVK